jgi:arginine exporter protein ArgO
MDCHLALQGVVVGFAVAAPLGPIGILVIRRSVMDGAATGFATGLGAALADTVFATLGALGLSVIVSGLERHEAVLRAVGGMLVLALGAHALAKGSRGLPMSDNGHSAPSAGRHVRLRALAGTFALTVANPLTIASFAAIAASAGVGIRGGSASCDAAKFAFGVFAGSSSWWFALSRTASLLRGRVSARGLRRIDQVSGGILVALAMVALASAWTSAVRET